MSAVISGLDGYGFIEPNYRRQAGQHPMVDILLPAQKLAMRLADGTAYRLCVFPCTGCACECVCV